jgi:hypothetical protein
VRSLINVTDEILSFCRPDANTVDLKMVIEGESAISADHSGLFAKAMGMIPAERSPGRKVAQALITLSKNRLSFNVV